MNKDTQRLTLLDNTCLRSSDRESVTSLTLAAHTLAEEDLLGRVANHGSANHSRDIADHNAETQHQEDELGGDAKGRHRANGDGGWKVLVASDFVVAPVNRAMVAHDGQT